MGVVNILFEDDFLLALNKPAGVAVHKGEGHEADNLKDLLIGHLQSRGIADAEGISPVHRIDRGTSGIVIFSRNPVVTKAFQTALQEGRVQRQYLALAQGVTHKKGAIKVPLTRQSSPNSAKSGPPQSAETRYRRLRYSRVATLVRVKPRTGRPHQIRRHLLAIGHPVAGDERWGELRFNRWIENHHGLKRMFLHAVALTFEHPITGEVLKLEAPLPEELQAVLGSLGFQDGASDEGERQADPL